MKSVLKILFLMICAIPCIWSIVKSYQPKIDNYEKYIKICKDCEYTQRKLQSALNSYSDLNSPIGDVRDEADFLNVEKLLINSGCLEKDYNRSTEECFYVIVDKEVTCTCHADVEDIEENIKRANYMLEKKYHSRQCDLTELAFCCCVLLASLFG